MGSFIRVLSSAKELWRYYVGIIVCSLATAAAGLAVPFIVKAATDYVVAALGDHNLAVGPVIGLAAALLVVDLAGTLISNWGGYLGDIMSVRLRAIMSERYFAKLLALPQRYFDDQLTGTIINRLTRSITEVTGFLNAFANGFFPMLLTVAAVLGICLFYSWPLAVLLTVIYPVFMWLTTRTSTRWQRIEGKKNAQLDAAGGRFAEVIGQIKVVRSFGQERSELLGFTRRYTTTVGLTREQSRYWHQMDVARRAALNVIFFGVFALIFAGTVRGTFTIGVMVLLIQLVNLARQPVFGMSYIVDFSQRALAGSRDYFAVLDLPNDPTSASLVSRPDDVPTAGASASAAAPPGVTARTDASHDASDAARTTRPAVSVGRSTTATAADEAQAASVARPTTTLPDDDARAAGAASGTHTTLTGPWTIAFEDVSFGYADGESVLRDVSFAVPAGAKVALVGESGGGKTTIASLLMRLYDPQAGRIEVAGRDIAAVPVEHLRASIAMVFQSPSLFSGTIRENIAYGRPDASDAQIERAAHLAGAHEFICRFTDGYDSTIGERGIKLSGGQGQRIAVARAILKDAPILVLDEATSSLDGKSERAVQRGLDHLMTGRTTLVIAHRLSTIAEVDLIVTLRDGRVDEVGSPAELATSGGVYSELLALQAGPTKKGRKLLAERFDIVR